jgi:hypothetical protein
MSNFGHGSANDPFSTEQTDPRFLSHFPAEPFSQLLPGLQVVESDMLLDMDDPSKWIAASETQWVGKLAPKSRFMFARVMPPEGFRLMGEHDNLVVAGDLFWDGAEWAEFDNQYDKEQAVKFAAKKSRGPAWIAKQESVSFQIPLPPRSRILWSSDRLRAGDKMACRGDQRWHPISDSLIGKNVQPPSDSNSFVRFIRSQSPEANNWYVHPELGSHENFGSADKPFDSLANARIAIETSAKNHGIAPQGIIWDHLGQPLFAYDPPPPRVEPIDLEPVEDMPENHFGELPRVVTAELMPPVRYNQVPRPAKQTTKVATDIRKAMTKLREAENALSAAHLVLQKALDLIE